MKGSRVLIFVVAYNAERHIELVLERLPAETYNDPRYHLLVIDDSSTDDSVGRSVEWLEQRGVGNATVLRNPLNLGYGGNQKLGYRYAIDHGFDLVILLHGDGQYDPALVPRFVEEYMATGADVILGSRMHSLRSAARGGMPFYKMIGNRTLTWFQNRVTGHRLSEYHTGYRGYSTALLKKIPFEINTNEFHFDTEILLQSFYVEARLAELPIPTRYGDEVCHVNGWKYSWDAARATLRYRMHTLGMNCSLKYRDLTPSRHLDKAWIPYSFELKALAAVRRLAPKKLLDLGCGAGHVARECESLGALVTGVDRDSPRAGRMSHFQAWDLGRGFPPIEANEFDVILMLDLIEHLPDPESFLLDLRRVSSSPVSVERPPTVILTTPNVAFLALRLNLLLGRFTYSERGIIDITHRRLFTKSTLLTMLDECGFDVVKVEGVGVPFEAVFGGRLGRLFGFIASALARAWHSLCAFQLLVVCRPRPGVEQLLLHSETFYEVGQRRPQPEAVE